MTDANDLDDNARAFLNEVGQDAAARSVPRVDLGSVDLEDIRDIQDLEDELATKKMTTAQLALLSHSDASEHELSQIPPTPPALDPEHLATARIGKQALLQLTLSNPDLLPDPSEALTADERAALMATEKMTRYQVKKTLEAARPLEDLVGRPGPRGIKGTGATRDDLAQEEKQGEGVVVEELADEVPTAPTTPPAPPIRAPAALAPLRVDDHAHPSDRFRAIALITTVALALLAIFATWWAIG